MHIIAFCLPEAGAPATLEGSRFQEVYDSRVPRPLHAATSQRGLYAHGQ